MAKNKLSDLNDHLFAALERLNDEELTSEQIESEAKRADAIMGISDKIIANAKITLDAMKLISIGNLDTSEIPESFGFKKINQ
jgi:ribosomal protein L17